MPLLTVTQTRQRHLSQAMQNHTAFWRILCTRKTPLPKAISYIVASARDTMAHAKSSDLCFFLIYRQAASGESVGWSEQAADRRPPSAFLRSTAMTAAPRALWPVRISVFSSSAATSFLLLLLFGVVPMVSSSILDRNSNAWHARFPQRGWLWENREYIGRLAGEDGTCSYRREWERLV